MRLEQDPDAVAFWEGVRRALKAFLEANRNGSNEAGKWTQAKLAGKLGIHAATLANFLCGTNHQLSGLAMAKACTLGIEFPFDHHRIVSLKEQVTPTGAHEQLVLEFSDDFSIAQPSGPLMIELRPKPRQTATSYSIRLKIVS
jgi:hypothetical protein